VVDQDGTKYQSQDTVGISASGELVRVFTVLSTLDEPLALTGPRPVFVGADINVGSYSVQIVPPHGSVTFTLELTRFGNVGGMLTVNTNVSSVELLITAQVANLDLCTRFPCGENTVCTDRDLVGVVTASGRDCVCNSGFEGNPLLGCTDIDECRDPVFPCPSRSLCINTVADFSCSPYLSAPFTQETSAWHATLTSGVLASEFASLRAFYGTPQQPKLVPCDSTALSPLLSYPAELKCRMPAGVGIGFLAGLEICPTVEQTFFSNGSWKETAGGSGCWVVQTNFTVDYPLPFITEPSLLVVGNQLDSNEDLPVVPTVVQFDGWNFFEAPMLEISVPFAASSPLSLIVTSLLLFCCCRTS
jgi:hypothetical protein